VGRDRQITRRLGRTLRSARFASVETSKRSIHSVRPQSVSRAAACILPETVGVHIYIDTRYRSWYTWGVEQSERSGAADDTAEGLTQAAILTVRHLSGRAALNLTAHMTLSTLEREGPVRVTTLAAAAGIGQPAMTEMIQRLERHGLVTRVDDPEDGRVALVGLSDAGRALRADQQRERRDRLAELLTALPAEDQAALNLAMGVALPIIRRLIDQSHRSRISMVDRTLDTPWRA
jgi:DNA-binding MarR family transcriptional regulator